jgi:uncharacterized repeat protein (TIGR01451 family)
MSESIKLLGIGALVLVCAVVSPVEGAEEKFLPADSEFQVNSYTTYEQGYSKVAAWSGGFVVVWDSYGSTGSDLDGFSIAGQRYAANGTPAGGEFQVNSYTTYYQTFPDVAADADGDFVVVWMSFGSSGTDDSSYSVQGQRYASDSTPAGGEFQINTYTTDYQIFPAVAAHSSGSFVVVWSSYGSTGSDTDYTSVQGQRYAANGSPLGGEFQVNSYTTYYQDYPDVALDGNGNFVVVWTSFGSAGTDPDISIQGQRYASDGSPQGGEFQVNTYTTAPQFTPAVAADQSGNFVVIWGSLGSAGTDTDATSIQGQRYASDGSPSGGQFQVNTVTTDFQGYPRVSMEPDGDFFVVWLNGQIEGFDADVKGQRYEADGTPIGTELLINTYTTDFQGFADIANDGQGQFVVTWTSYGSYGTDDDYISVQAQRYISEADLAITKSDSVTTAAPGQSLVYTIVATNNGPEDVPAATIADTFPAELACSWTSMAVGATGNTSGSGNLNDTLSMPVGSTVTYTVTCVIDPSASGTLTNTATISSPIIDPVPGNNNATDADTQLIPETDLILVKSGQPNPVMPGRTVTFTLSVTNSGPSDSSGGMISDTLPVELSFTSSPDCSAAGQDLACPVPALPAGASINLSFDALVAMDAESITNTATIAGNENDPVAVNDVSTAVIAVQPLLIPTLSRPGVVLLVLVIGAVAILILRRQGG